MNVCVTVLVGLPASGKTTFSQTLKENYTHYDGINYNFIHVSYDELLPNMNFDELGEEETKYKELRTEISNQIDVLLICIQNNNFDNCPTYFRNQLKTNSPESVIVILIDDNMYLRSMRYHFFKKAKQYNVSFCQVYFKCSIEESVERNFSRTSKSIVPLHVITEMNRKMEAPKNEKWEKNCLVYETFNSGIQLYTLYFQLLRQALDSPECMKDESDSSHRQQSVIVCTTNVLHQCDIALRQIISSKINKYRCDISCVKDNKTLQKYSSDLSLVKSKILNDIKSGAIYLSQDVLNEIQQNPGIEKKQLRAYLEGIFN